MLKILYRIKTDIIRLWKPLGIVCLVFAVLLLAFGEVCPMKIILGVPCPGCGLTHSCFYILTLRWKRAWQYNPTGFLWTPSLLLWCFARYCLGRRSKLAEAMIILSGIASIALYLCNLLA